MTPYLTVQDIISQAIDELPDEEIDEDEDFFSLREGLLKQTTSTSQRPGMILESAGTTDIITDNKYSSPKNSQHIPNSLYLAFATRTDQIHCTTLFTSINSAPESF